MCNQHGRRRTSGARAGASTGAGDAGGGESRTSAARGTRRADNELLKCSTTWTRSHIKVARVLSNSNDSSSAASPPHSLRHPGVPSHRHVVVLQLSSPSRLHTRGPAPHRGSACRLTLLFTMTVQSAPLRLPASPPCASALSETACGCVPVFQGCRQARRSSPRPPEVVLS